MTDKFNEVDNDIVNLIHTIYNHQGYEKFRDALFSQLFNDFMVSKNDAEALTNIKSQQEFLVKLFGLIQNTAEVDDNE